MTLVRENGPLDALERPRTVLEQRVPLRFDLAWRLHYTALDRP
jgi:hypothetical protein